MNSFLRRFSNAAAAGALAVAIVVPSLAYAAADHDVDLLPDTKNAPAEMPAKAAKNEQVVALQQALNKTGAGLMVDGRMGPRTRAALKKYQHSMKLKATGTLDAATRKSLKI